MLSVQIHHHTTYRYTHPVVLGPHRLMLRPRESCDLRLLSIDLTATPAATVTWAEDVFGNAVAMAVFAAPAETLSIECRLRIELHAVPFPIFTIAAEAISYPFLYTDSDWIDLGALATARTFDPTGRVETWARGFILGNPTDTLSLLKDLCSGVSAWVAYQSRDDEGTQTPLQTLECGSGACRDFAVLFVEAARCLGFGARVVSGYLFDPDGCLIGSSGNGSTHAWAEVFVPGAGWITFDPTNRGVGGHNLIPVAVAREIAQVTPVSGSYQGSPDAFVGMSVDVRVTA
ncbi:transglutaminase family protein [Magnetospirillum fulvum]|uniref:Transglutaminase-like enzyme, putative cysteine protease n=1 Tax=Magnetospirillum fulvum TaxID=1082 RepID=A0A1H6H4R6_MAGFU|nr:transglutaminase family protein [Magnetospirillum fulvum]SEH30711.1 Transglutaminase-like enzyme, putative cysteine protease [Magnetospirillum fulvum]